MAKKSAKTPAKKTTPPVKRLLHVGCGEATAEKLPAFFRTPEWQEVRLDIDEKVKPDIVANMTDMHMIASGSMDGLFSSHNLEHLHPHQVPGALQEFRRVLRPGGVVMLTMPDLQAVAAYIADGRLENPLYESPSGAISPIDIVYGFRKAVSEGHHFMAHKGGFSAVTLARHLSQAGFATISVQRDWLDLWAVGYNLPKEHPQYRGQVVIRNKNISGSPSAPLPFWYNRQLQSQGNVATRTDELDAAPRIWKPLGLKTRQMQES